MVTPSSSDTAPDLTSDVLSKTQRKKAMQALQDLGEALVRLPNDRLLRIDLPETLLQAVQDCKQIRSHGARRRQLQWIGKLMRHTEEAPIRAAIEAYQLGTARDTLDFHRAESWRARLLAHDDVLTEWVKIWPQSDLPRLRTLIRQARKETQQAPAAKGGRFYRELFQFIKPFMQHPEHDDPQHEH